jgi:hypothetical protein
VIWSLRSRIPGFRFLISDFRLPAPAARLALLRIIIGGFALGYVIVRAPALADFSGRSDWQFAPVGIVNVLAGPLPGTAVHLLVALTAVSGLAFVCGWRYRWTAPVFALALLWTMTYRNSWGQIFHTENLMVMHVFILALSPAADAFSLDAKRTGFAPADDARYAWPTRLMCAVTVLTYFISGQTKLRNAGLDWVTTDSLRNYVAYDNLRKAELGDTHSILGAFMVRHEWLFPPFAAATLAIELGAPLALLNHRLARAWAASAWLFHFGILLIMAILFPYPLAGPAFAPFFAVERIRIPALRWVRGRKVRTAEG